MRLILLACVAFCMSVSLQAQSFSAAGTFKEETPGGGMGLDKVYVFKSLAGASITYSASSPIAITPHMYINSIGDKTELPGTDYTANSTSCTVTKLEDARGYIFDVGGQMKTVWVIDYSLHQPVLNSIEVKESDDKCEYLKLYILKSEDDLVYKGTNGLVQSLPRLYTVEYENLRWNGASASFERYQEIWGEGLIGTDVNIPAPLTSTRFVVKGDQYASGFGMVKELSSSDYEAVATQGYLFAERDGVDVTADLTEDFKGSAPLQISFIGVGNEPTAHYYTWYIYNLKNTEEPIARFTDKEIKYEFTESGSYKVVLELANAASSCVSTVEKVFNIAESYLDAPNYFSPGDSPGINDEFKVSYKSLVQFKCTIFNRWGVKLYEWTDPEKGWDGKHNGQYVSTGVYFYVIQAKGSDGRVYKKKGDINIVRGR